MGDKEESDITKGCDAYIDNENLSDEWTDDINKNEIQTVVSDSHVYQQPCVNPVNTQELVLCKQNEFTNSSDEILTEESKTYPESATEINDCHHEQHSYERDSDGAINHHADGEHVYSSSNMASEMASRLETHLCEMASSLETLSCEMERMKRQLEQCIKGARNAGISGGLVVQTSKPANLVDVQTSTSSIIQTRQVSLDQHNEYKHRDNTKQGHTDNTKDKDEQLTANKAFITCPKNVPHSIQVEKCRSQIASPVSSNKTGMPLTSTKLCQYPYVDHYYQCFTQYKNCIIRNVCLSRIHVRYLLQFIQIVFRHGMMNNVLCCFVLHSEYVPKEYAIYAVIRHAFTDQDTAYLMMKNEQNTVSIQRTDGEAFRQHQVYFDGYMSMYHGQCIVGKVEGAESIKTISQSEKGMFIDPASKSHATMITSQQCMQSVDHSMNKFSNELEAPLSEDKKAWTKTGHNKHTNVVPKHSEKQNVRQVHLRDKKSLPRGAHKRRQAEDDVVKMVVFNNDGEVNILTIHDLQEKTHFNYIN